MDKVPAAAKAEHGDALETFLVDLARQQSPDRVAKPGSTPWPCLDPDGTLTRIRTTNGCAG